MASGKAIIASDLPALKEILTNEKNSMLCEPENIKQWIDTINKLILKKQLRAIIGQNARSEFLEKYTWNKRAQIVLKSMT